MNDWKAIAHARGLKLSEPELDRIAEVLGALDDTLRPLTGRLSYETEPATVFPTMLSTREPIE